MRVRQDRRSRLWSLGTSLRNQLEPTSATGPPSPMPFNAGPSSWDSHADPGECEPPPKRSRDVPLGRIRKTKTLNARAKFRVIRYCGMRLQVVVGAIGGSALRGSDRPKPTGIPGHAALRLRQSSMMPSQCGRLVACRPSCVRTRAVRRRGAWASSASKAASASRARGLYRMASNGRRQWSTTQVCAATATLRR